MFEGIASVCATTIGHSTQNIKLCSYFRRVDLESCVCMCVCAKG